MKEPAAWMAAPFLRRSGWTAMPHADPPNPRNSSADADSKVIGG